MPAAAAGCTGSRETRLAKVLPQCEGPQAACQGRGCMSRVSLEAEDAEGSVGSMLMVVAAGVNVRKVRGGMGGLRDKLAGATRAVGTPGVCGL